MKTQLTLASVIAAGLLASGCSQQMVAQQAVAVETQPVVKTVVDCSNCNKPTPVKPAVNNKWGHTHPAIPGCTDSTTHTHKYNNRNHKHKYSCKKATPRRQVPEPACVTPKPAPISKPAPVRPVVPTPRPMKRCWHGRNAQGQCNPKPHVRRPVYRPMPKPVMPVVPKVKAKGTYRGPIKIDGVMQQYQQ